MSLHFILHDLKTLIDANELKGIQYKIVEDEDDVAIQLTDNTVVPITSLAYTTKDNATHLILMYRLTLSEIPLTYLTTEVYESLTTWSSDFGLAFRPETSNESDGQVIPIAIVFAKYATNLTTFRRNVDDALTRIRNFHIKYGDDLKGLFSAGI
jgi:hypothetical protein